MWYLDCMLNSFVSFFPPPSASPFFFPPPSASPLFFGTFSSLAHFSLRSTFLACSSAFLCKNGQKVSNDLRVATPPLGMTGWFFPSHWVVFSVRLTGFAPPPRGRAGQTAGGPQTDEKQPAPKAPAKKIACFCILRRKGRGKSKWPPPPPGEGRDWLVFKSGGPKKSGKWPPPPRQ